MRGRAIVLNAFCLLLSFALAGCDRNQSARNEDQNNRGDAGALAVADSGGSAGAQSVETRKPVIGDDEHELSTGVVLLALPTTERSHQLITLNAAVPTQVRAGQSFNYVLKVANSSQNMTLNHVRVAQDIGRGLEISASNPPRLSSAGQANFSGSNHSSASGRQASAGNSSPGDSSNPKSNPLESSDDSSAKKQSQGKQKSSDQKSSGSPSKNDSPGESDRSPDEQSQEEAVWSIGRLSPGETKTIQVSAIAGEEGTLQNCFSVQYEPVICVATEVVKPELSLTKTAPGQSSICEQIVLRYQVRNTGTAATQDCVVRDPLPEGLKTLNGEQEVKFEVGALAPGEDRELKAIVIASKEGEFSSRATAQSGKLSAQSAKSTTTVNRPQLTLELGGPGSQVVNRDFAYEVNVRNDGRVAARDVLLKMQLGDPLRIRSAQSTLDRQGDYEVVGLGDLKPGEGKKFWISLTGRNGGNAESKFIVSSDCGQGDLQVSRMIATQILSFPALHLLVVDNKDPVRSGEEFSYTIQVVNEGTAQEQNVRVEAKLPDGVEFVKASGESSGTAKGQTVTFEPIPKLVVGQECTWTIYARASGEGSKKIEVTLNSNSLKEAVRAEEPTRLFSIDTNSNDTATKSKKSSDKERGGNAEASEEKLDAEKQSTTSSDNPKSKQSADDANQSSSSSKQSSSQSDKDDQKPPTQSSTEAEKPSTETKAKASTENQAKGDSSEKGTVQKKDQSKSK